jgi:hypothetical protein
MRPVVIGRKMGDEPPAVPPPLALLLSVFWWPNDRDAAV